MKKERKQLQILVWIRPILACDHIVGIPVSAHYPNLI